MATYTNGGTINQWIIDESGVYKSVHPGASTTLRSDYIAAFVPPFTLDGSSNRTTIPISSESVDINNAANWVAGDTDGMILYSATNRILVTVRNQGPATRTVTIPGTSAKVLTLAPGTMDSALIDTANYGVTPLFNLDAATGLTFIAVAK